VIRLGLIPNIAANIQEFSVSQCDHYDHNLETVYESLVRTSHFHDTDEISVAGRHSVRLYAGLTMSTILIFYIADSEGLLPDLSANILVVG